MLEQDRIGLEGQRGLQSRVNEHLAQADIGVIRLRRMFQQELARQRAVYDKAAGTDGHTHEAPGDGGDGNGRTAAPPSATGAESASVAG